ncbi:hypothetical protein K438DRAFT_2007932 [Mycena galopus ATCC 62051]|nr:hypothetical protein K438DRAFT_2007932 [Mycena galopus ATCC 62051]
MPEARELRQMDNLDIEKTRDDEQASEKATQEEPQSQDSPADSISRPLRPLTRSLTGRASKPRARDDSWYEPPKKGTARKKPPTKSPRKRTIDEVDRAESEDPQDAPPPPRPPPLFVDASPNPNPISPDPSVLTPSSSLSSSLSFSATAFDATGRPTAARARTTLPVPVPNLIKKSRGRRVPVAPSIASASASASTSTAANSASAATNPTSDSASASGGPGETSKRLHVCKVEGCGKCFHRGEHLKRHIRSIHTHEKRGATSHATPARHQHQLRNNIWCNSPPLHLHAPRMHAGTGSACMYARALVLVLVFYPSFTRSFTFTFACLFLGGVRIIHRLRASGAVHPAPPPASHRRAGRAQRVYGVWCTGVAATLRAGSLCV